MQFLVSRWRRCVFRSNSHSDSHSICRCEFAERPTYDDAFVAYDWWMITAGVDLSSQVAKTAACVIDWFDEHAKVVELTQGVDDDSISALIAKVDKLGIDVPLGWPIAFAEAVFGYSADGSWPTEYRHTENKNYRYRRTDLWVWNNLETSPPLSVSADRISLPAMRAAALLSHVSQSTARDGSGVVVEVYPAAALRRWGLRSRQYKRKENSVARRELVARLLTETLWLSIESSDVDLCIDSDDAFDALVAALVARAAAIELVDPIPNEDLTSALREGWIAVPVVGSLNRLSVG
jgi:predicted nuclease with RNAse H fold